MNFSSQSCPAGTVWSDEQISCQLECPIPVMTRRQYDETFFITIVFGWLSFISSLIMVLTYTIFEKNRQWPRRIILYVNLSNVVVNFTFAVNSFFSVDEIICSTNGWQPNHGGWCEAQGILLIYGGGFASFWLLVLSFHFFYVGLFARNADSAWLEKWYHLVGWLPGLIFGTTAAAQHITGGSYGLPFCFIGANNPFSTAWIYFHGPNLFCLLLVAYFVICTCLSLWLRSETRSITKHLLRMLLYLLMFIIFGVFVIACIVSLELVAERELVDLYNYYICLMTTNPTVTTPSPTISSSSSTVAVACPLPIIANVWLLYANALAVSWQGVWILILFGISPANLALWRELLCRCRTTQHHKKIVPVTCGAVDDDSDREQTHLLTVDSVNSAYSSSATTLSSDFSSGRRTNTLFEIIPDDYRFNSNS